MDSFVFDVFKKNILEGNLNQETTWELFPVNKKFTEDMEDTLKYIKHTYDIPLLQSSANNPDSLEKNVGLETSVKFPSTYLTNMMAFNYTYKSMYETDQPSQPLYISEDNFDQLKEAGIISDAEEHLRKMFFDDKYYFGRENKQSGFYYVKTSEELLWCANAVNGTQFDNTINIVLGDNIGIIDENIDITNVDDETDNISNRNKLKKIKYCIGSNPAQPFNGIFFGNGYSFVNIELVCENDTTGIFGYLGYDGILSTVYIRGFNIVTCNKKINMDHMVTNGTDVYAGLLCGKNNGKITNVCVEGSIVFNGFVPSIYSVNNKTENRTEENPGNYDYYPDFYCFDSPGNIIPYLGYFNEGVFATYSAYDNVNGNKYAHYWNTDMTYKTLRCDSNGNVVSPIEWLYWEGTTEESIGNFIHYTHPLDRINVLWYDGQMIANTNALHGINGLSICENGLYNYGDGTSGQNRRYNCGDSMKNLRYADYFNTSIKLSEQNRVAYYVSPLVGSNNSYIQNTIINASLYTSGTFVGFMGGVVGKQSNGVLSNVKSSISSYDVVNEEAADNTDVMFYKRDYYTATQLPSFDSNEENKLYFNFAQKSIKNISSLFGSCVLSNINALKLTDVDSYFNNFNNIVLRDGYNNDPEYDDYYFMNRFGAFAAIVEYHSSNISDMWTSKEDANDGSKRCILAHNCKFSYKENIYCPNDSDYNVTLKTIRNVVSDSRLTKLSHYDMCGIGAPLFAELKPIYKTVPSVISTFYDNLGALVTQSTDEASKFYHIGLFGVDQNFAAPPTDPDFRCIDLEVDLPGVANGYTYQGQSTNAVTTKILAGGVVDRVNNCESNNFNVVTPQRLVGSLINWDNTMSYIVNNNRTLDTVPYRSVRIPAAAKIDRPRYVTPQNVHDGDVYSSTEYVTTGNVPDGAYLCGESSVFDYCANKIKHNYSYYGSDLRLIVERDAKPAYTDLGRTNGKIIFQFINDAYYNYSAYDMWKTFLSHDTVTLANCVSAIRMEIDGRAFDYIPFTDKEITNDQINEYYNMSAWCSEANGCSDLNDRNNTWVELEKYNDCNIYDFTEAFSGSENDLDDWFGTSALSGFSFCVDFSQFLSKSKLMFVIPFNMVPYAIDKTECFNPPYQKFEGFYAEVSANSDTDLSANWIRYAAHASNAGHPSRHNYFVQDPNFTVRIEDATSSTPHRSWLDTGYSGKFVNYFISGAETDHDYLTTATSEDTTIFNESSAYLTSGMSDDDNSIIDKINDNISNGKSKESDENVSNFKYTYDKDYGTKITPPFLLPVKYDNKNGKNGFWFQASAASGDFEYNDKVNYYGNVYYIGKTLSQDALLKKCLLIDEHVWSASGISADDFEGIYIQDSDQNPVMYIDVGLGECQDGTTWSLSSYPSVDSATFIEEYSASNEDATEEEITSELNKALNNCSGLFLEVKLDEQ